MTVTDRHGIDALALIFKLNNGLVTRAIEGLPDADFWRQPAGIGNPIGWLLGHATETRVQLLGELGSAEGMPWNEAFSRGGPVRDAAAYPAREAIEAAWGRTRAQMREAFAKLTPEALAAASAGRRLPGAQTLAERLGFFAFHESYHVGQMGYVRRLLGHSPIAD